MSESMNSMVMKHRSSENVGADVVAVSEPYLIGRRPFSRRLRPPADLQIRDRNNANTVFIS